MRVLIVTNMYPSKYRLASGIFVKRQIEILKDLGVEVVLARAKDDRPNRNLIKWYSDLGWDTFKKSFDTFNLVHVHYPMMAGFYGSLAAGLRNKPLVLTIHGGEIDLDKHISHNSSKKTLMRATTNWALRRADAVIVVGKYLVDLVSLIGVSAKKISVIDMGVDLNTFKPHNKETAIQALGLSGKGPRIVCIASLKLFKGQEYFIRAANQLRTKYPESQWYLVGWGPLEGEMRSLVRELHLETQVKIVGQRPPDEIPLWDSVADVLVMPSTAEPFGLAAIEAMACSTPVVASNVGGLPDFVTDGFNGFLVSPANPIAIAEKVDQILRDPNLADYMGQNGILTAKKHEAHIQTQKVLDIYKSVISNTQVSYSQ